MGPKQANQSFRSDAGYGPPTYPRPRYPAQQAARLQQPGYAENAKVDVRTLGDVVAVQNQYEAYYDEVTATSPSRASKKRNGMTPADDEDSLRMPAPRRPEEMSKATRAPLLRTDDLSMQPFDNVRKTLATDAEHF